MIGSKMNATAVAAELGLAVCTVYWHLKRGNIKAQLVYPRCYLFTRASVEKLRKHLAHVHRSQAIADLPDPPNESENYQSGIPGGDRRHVRDARTKEGGFVRFTLAGGARFKGRSVFDGAGNE